MFLIRTSPILLLLGLLAGCVPPANEEGSALRELIDHEWAFRLEEDPLTATAVGVHEYDDRLPSVDPADLERRAGYWNEILAELDEIDLDALDGEDRINYEIFRRQLENRVADHTFGTWQIPLNADSGFHMSFARLPQRMTLLDSADYDNYIARLRAVPGYFLQQTENMRRGLQRGMTLPRVVLEGYDGTISAHVVDGPEDSVFWAPFVDLPSTVPPEDHDRLRDAARAAITEQVVPAYRNFLTFMVDEYVPGARTTLGASELPEGQAYYEHLIRNFTTLDLTAEEIHGIGLTEVERIRGEMQKVIARVEFDGDFGEFLEFLRSDPRFYVQTPQQLVKQAAWLAKKMDAQLPSLFKTLPRLPYGVAPVPDSIAPKYTGGRYIPAPAGSTEPGYYWVNTYDLPSRPLYTLESLTLHEAVPGHHLQGALSAEREDLLPFRRYSYISAFGEGWGLYSEWLGLEAGFYTDPYSNFGRLTYEMWRACRLVVDTGLHDMNWTREQAMEFLVSNTALSLHEVRTETDRYIAWPGQALSYKIGELKIKELRRRAEKALGMEFDVREFHDVVLLNGSVPLPVLERLVDEYIARNS